MGTLLGVHPIVPWTNNLGVESYGTGWQYIKKNHMSNHDLPTSVAFE